MNRDYMEKRILLAESGELPEKGVAELHATMEERDDVRRWRDDVRRISAAAREALPRSGPSPAVISAIRSAAEARAGRRLVFSPPAVHALAWAATLAVLLGGWLFVASNGDLNHIRDINAIAVMISDTQTTAVAGGNGKEKDRELRALARQLLIMEGFSMDDVELADETDVSPLEEEALSPTVLQWRRTPSSAARTCV